MEGSNLTFHCLLQAVERLVIGREGMGEIAFIDAVDLRGLCLDDIVNIEKGRMQVYGLPGGVARPPPNSGLNMPALLTFRCVVTHLLSRRVAIFLY